MSEAGDIIGLGVAGAIGIGMMGMMYKFAGPHAQEANSERLGAKFINRFLDAWYRVNPKTFDNYHEDFGGHGRSMVGALRDDNPQRYQRILNAM
tara:strand:- start:6 stop:287 length:282 start_codon:yes stop_codon:yes gene_type:complete